jgi:hypothetical protein
MTWLLRTLVGAVIAGVGWKIGTEAVEYLKKNVLKREPDGSAKPEDGAGPAATDVATPAP